MKDCYDTYEKIKARMKFQTENCQQLVVKDCESNSEALFTETFVEDVVPQVGIKELHWVATLRDI